MKNFFRIGLVAVLAFVAPLGAVLAQTSNPSNCTLSGCQQSWTQNGVQSFVRTYKLSLTGQAFSGTGDIFSIAGAPGKTIRIAKIVVGGQATGAAFFNPNIIRRSTADTAGTCVAQTAASRDTNNAASVAGLSLCSVAPTSGTAVATMDSCRLFLGIVGTPSVPDVCAFTYGVNDDQMPVLRGALDILAINFGIAAPAGAVIDVDVEWTEE